MLCILEWHICSKNSCKSSSQHQTRLNLLIFFHLVHRMENFHCDRWVIPHLHSCVSVVYQTFTQKGRKSNNTRLKGQQSFKMQWVTIWYNLFIHRYFHNFGQMFSVCNRSTNNPGYFRNHESTVMIRYITLNKKMNVNRLRIKGLLLVEKLMEDES